MRNFLLTIVVVCLVAVGVAFYLGWVTVSTDREEGKITTHLVIYTGKVEDAAHTAEDKVKHMGESVKNHVPNSEHNESVKGTVYAIDGDRKHFTLATAEGKEIIISMEPNMPVTGLEREVLQVGNQVTVVYKTEDGKNSARSITVNSGT